MITRKTTKEISDEILARLESAFNTSIPLLQRAFNRVVAKALGGSYTLLYQYANWILLQQFVKTASSRSIEVNGTSLNPLQAHGDLVGIYQGAGLRAEQRVSVSVLVQGGTILSGERLANPGTQMIYAVIGDVSLNSATVTATVRATKPGVLGNVDTGTVLSFVSPPDSVAKDTTVTSIVVEGVDPESTESYRERILERWLARPQGGSYADYKSWAEEVDGVRNAYVYSGWGEYAIPSSSTGQVFVYVESDVDADGIPSSALLTSVAEHIEGDGAGLANRRPVNTYVQVYPITRTGVDINIQGLTVDAEDTSVVQDAIEDALSEFLLDRTPGGQAGYTVLPPRRDVVSTSELSGVAAQIAAGYNGVIGSLVTSVDSTYYLQEGEMAKLGTVTWT
jgi:uncharacterized phage protein gp47/JayE